MYRFFVILFSIFALTLIFQSCNLYKKFYDEKLENLKSNITDGKITDNFFKGFLLYDLKNKKEVLNINGNKYFTPASNTKLFTFYTSLNILEDSIPALKYYIRGDSLFFWGTGNPNILNRDLPADSTVINFLRSREEKLFYLDDNFSDERYGDGWAWNDYFYNYQLDKSSLPVFGNSITIAFTTDSNYVYPEFFTGKILFIPDSFIYNRSFDKNDFIIGTFKSGDFLTVPFKTGADIVLSALSSATGKTIDIFSDKDLIVTQSATLKQKTEDSIYIRLLHNSDNFIAEQLLLMCSFVLFDTLETKKIINFSKQNLMPYLQDSCRWVDGSGLSRYNLFSPNSVIRVLNQIYNKIGLQKIKILFPEIAITEDSMELQKYSLTGAGVYAKSGSLSNNYNLSGYIITKQSNIYLFSFMNNHFLGSNKMVRSDVKNTLRYIVDNY